MKKAVVRKLMIAGAFGVAVTCGVLSAQGARTKVVWYVGLGTGSNVEQVKVEEDLVARYNKSQNKIELILEIVENASGQSQSQLATRIAAGNPPDLVGPVGIEGAGIFAGQWANLDPLVDKFKPNLSGMDPALVKFYKEDQKGEGLPYAVFPSFFYINKDLFDEAKLPYPPQRFGEKYQGKEWNWATMRELAMKLTVDSNGKQAGQAGFDPNKIVQYGYVPQWTTLFREMGTMFGAGSLVDSKGNAQVPENWAQAWKFFYNGIWKDRFMASAEIMGSDDFGRGNPFNSGKFAMGFTHLWYTCCLEAPKDGGKVKRWTVAVVPSYQGKYTAKLNADTFRITNKSPNKEAAFQAMWWLMNRPELLKIYGAFPADRKYQRSFMADVDQKYAPNKINWQTVRDSLKYVDNPNAESMLPNFLKSKDILAKYEARFLAANNINIDQMITELRAELQRAFDEKR